MQFSAKYVITIEQITNFFFDILMQNRRLPVRDSQDSSTVVIKFYWRIRKYDEQTIIFLLSESALFYPACLSTVKLILVIIYHMLDYLVLNWNDDDDSGYGDVMTKTIETFLEAYIHWSWKFDTVRNCCVE